MADDTAPPIVATRVTMHEAKRHFEAGGAVLVSEYGHEPTQTVTAITTTHDRTRTTWDALAADVKEWRNRYPNQRFYIVPQLANSDNRATNSHERGPMTTTTTTTDPHALPIAETEGRGDVYARQLRQHNSTVSMYAANPENVSGDERAVLDLATSISRWAQRHGDPFAAEYILTPLCEGFSQLLDYPTGRLDCGTLSGWVRGLAGAHGFGLFGEAVQS